MKEIIINGKKFLGKEGTPLKDVLMEYGMEFPCGGNGKCGKCRIKCKDLLPTEKDHRFLTENAINEGWRIACDKFVDGDISLDCPPPIEKKNRRKLSACNIIANIGIKNITIGIVDDEIAEEIVVRNPLYTTGGFVELSRKYEQNKEEVSNDLRSALTKPSIDFFEEYGKAKAQTFAVSGNGIFLKILAGLPLDGEIPSGDIVTEKNFDLPTETVYFLPCVNEFCGGDILSETVGCQENTLLIDCDKVFVAFYVGKENNVVATMWDISYDEIGLKAIRAVIKSLIPEGYTPIVKLYGDHSEEIERILLSEGLNYSFNEKQLSNPAKVLLGLRFRAKLNKEKARTSVMNVLTNEKFHNYFAE